MTEAFIGIGSNIEPEKFILMALERLRQKLSIISISPFYRTKAVGTAAGQADFINGMIKIETILSAKNLKFSVLREVEFELGRLRDMPKHAPRTLDLDLVIFGDEVIPELNIPEPDILNRPYVFVPLLDIDANYKLPGQHKFLRDQVKSNVKCIKGKTLTSVHGASLTIHELLQ